MSKDGFTFVSLRMNDELVKQLDELKWKNRTDRSKEIIRACEFIVTSKTCQRCGTINAQNSIRCSVCGNIIGYTDDEIREWASRLVSSNYMLNMIDNNKMPEFDSIYSYPLGKNNPNGEFVLTLSHTKQSGETEIVLTKFITSNEIDNAIKTDMDNIIHALDNHKMEEKQLKESLEQQKKTSIFPK